MFTSAAESKRPTIPGAPMLSCHGCIILLPPLADTVQALSQPQHVGKIYSSYYRLQGLTTARKVGSQVQRPALPEAKAQLFRGTDASSHDHFLLLPPLQPIPRSNFNLPLRLRPAVARQEDLLVSPRTSGPQTASSRLPIASLDSYTGMEASRDGKHNGSESFGQDFPGVSSGTSMAGTRNREM